MGPEQRADYERQSQDLKLELKKWENKWAEGNKGKKPGRDAIKQNPEIGMPPPPIYGVSAELLLTAK